MIRGYRRERFFEMLAVSRNAYHTHFRTLPKLLMFELGNRYVIVRPQPVFQAAEHLSLVLEGLCVGDVNFQGKEADRHWRPAETRNNG